MSKTKRVPPRVLKATYPNEEDKTIISIHVNRKLKYRRWWWEKNNLFISFYKEEDYSNIKITLLCISHDLRLGYPNIRRELKNLA